MVTGLGGCVTWLTNGREAGTLVVDNRHSEAHTVTVTVTKTSEDSADVGGRDETPAPETDPIWRREDEFAVDAGEQVEHEAFISETGSFFIEVRLETGERASGWVGFYSAGPDGTDIAEDAIFVDIYEDGRVTLFTSHSD